MKNWNESGGVKYENWNEILRAIQQKIMLKLEGGRYENQNEILRGGQ